MEMVKLEVDHFPFQHVRFVMSVGPLIGDVKEVIYDCGIQKKKGLSKNEDTSQCFSSPVRPRTPFR